MELEESGWGQPQGNQAGVELGDSGWYCLCACLLCHIMDTDETRRRRRTDLLKNLMTSQPDGWGKIGLLKEFAKLQRFPVPTDCNCFCLTCVTKCQPLVLIFLSTVGLINSWRSIAKTE